MSLMAKSGFYSTSMINSSTRKDVVNHVTFIIKDGLTSEYIGEARMADIEHVYIDMPEVRGMYRVKPGALEQLKKHFITSLDELFHKSWLVSEGDYILRNSVPVK